MSRSSTVPREGPSVSTTGIAQAERDGISSNRKASAQAFSAHRPIDSAAVKSLASNELLFGIGYLKSQFYAVKSGALVVYEPRWNGHRAVIEFAFPGDLVGLGFLTDAHLQRQSYGRDVRAMFALERARSLVC